MNKTFERFILRISDKLLGYEVSKQLLIQRSYSKMSEQFLVQLQLDKLNAILNHATGTVNAYKSYQRRNHGAEEFLSQFPVLTKLNLQGNEQEFISDRFALKSLIKLESSGSSGVKSTVFLSKKEHSILRAILINWWEWTGYCLGKPILQTGITPNRGVLKGIKDRLVNTIYCDAFGIDEEEAIHSLKKISRYKSAHLGGFASSLYVLAEFAEKNQMDIKFDAAISWGDKMFDHYKSKIESVFKTKVYENYGCNEGLMIGQKVDLDYFYIYTPNIYLELLDDRDQPVHDGEIGRVVVTKLDGYAMPLIRYDTGDIAVKLPKNEYPKQRKFAFPLLKRVIGRNTDIIKTPEGKNLIVHTFTGIFEFYKEIRQFRVVQERLDSIEIEYIPSDSFYKDVLSKLEKHIREKTKSTIIINWKKVSEIPTTGSGKPQLIKNLSIERSLADEQ